MDARFEDELASSVPGWKEIPPKFSADAVRHNGSESRFELETDGRLSFVEYRMEGDRMVIVHTFVPADLRGRKLAEQVVAAALKHARECRFRVVPQCSYVRSLLARREDFADLRIAE